MEGKGICWKEKYPIYMDQSIKIIVDVWKGKQGEL